MQVSEQNKQEAEKVYSTYYNLWLYSSSMMNNETIVTFAIQDRQSVLDNNLKMISQLMKSKKAVIALSTENRNLTEQIEYLKSKL
jgi:hypothetical protein